MLPWNQSVSSWFLYLGCNRPAYVDDLLVYEGADAVDLAVEQLPDKLTTIWATIKTQNDIQ